MEHGSSTKKKMMNFVAYTQTDEFAEAPQKGITARAFFYGSLLSLAIGIGVAYADNAIRGSYMGLDFGSPAAIFVFFLFVLFINPLLGLIRRSWHLSEGETALVYIMALLATAMPSMGLTGFFMAYLTGAFYYATPENEWGELFLSHIERWMVVDDPLAIQYFYEGNPSGGGIPWDIWLPVFLAWLPFLAALYLLMIALMVILRRQWMENERLLYPLMQAPLALIAPKRNSLWPRLLHSWTFWIGLGIPFSVGMINGLHAYFPVVPAIELRGSLPIFRNSTTLSPTLSFTTLGISYFLSRDIALGIWFFNLVAKIQEGSFNVLGIASNERMEWVTVPILAHQSIGAMTVLVLFGLWMGRSHLQEIVRKVVHSGSGIDDSGEIMSYRTALLISLGGTLIVGWWLWLSGLPLWAVPLVIFVAFVIFIGLTRMVTEGGFFITRAPINPGNFMVYGFGVEALGPSGTTALGFTFVWAGEMRIFIMAACANALKVGQNMGGNRKHLLWAMLTAILLSGVGSIWIDLELCYRYGGINLSNFFTSLVNYPFNFISRNLLNETAISWAGWAWTAWGSILMGLLMYAKQRLLWWPIHPMSLPISSMWMTDTIMLSVFLSWMIKGIILKYGGPGLYNRSKPFFIGLVVGQFTSMGFWLVVDYFTGMTDNLVWWL